MNKSNNQLTVIDDIRSNVVVGDHKKYKVPTASVFGRGVSNKVQSFGGRTLSENAKLVDDAIDNTRDLQEVWNHSHSQWIWKHLTLSFHSPWRNMKQIEAEMSRKRSAINEAKWNQIRNEVKIRKYEEKLEKEDLDYWKEIDIKIKLAQLREGIVEGTYYIEGAMKDILSLNDLYEQLKKQVSDFSEEDFEKSESKSHLSRSLMQCIRDVRQQGCISKGEQEYLEQIGVNPSKMQVVLRDYVKKEAEQPDWGTTLLMEFIENLTNDMIDNHKVDVKRMAAMGFNSEHTLGIGYENKVAKKENADHSE